MFPNPTALMWDAFDMPHLPLEDRAELPQEAGVYVVYKAEQVLYIGEAHNLRLRFTPHHRLHQFIALSPGVEIAWRTMPDHTPGDRAIYERSLMAFFKPQFNGTYYVDSAMTQQATIGKKLRLLRERLDRSQRTVARDLKIAQQSCSLYEQGLINIPISKLELFAEYYAVPIAWLVESTDTEPPNLPGYVKEEPARVS